MECLHVVRGEGWALKKSEVDLRDTVNLDYDRQSLQGCVALGVDGAFGFIAYLHLRERGGKDRSIGREKRERENGEDRNKLRYAEVSW